MRTMTVVFCAGLLLSSCGPRDDDERPVAQDAAASAEGLKVGEYACYGSGGTLLIGLGFKVTEPGRYTDLDGGSAGRYKINGSTVTFTGGHLDGETGRDLKDGKFTIGTLAGCEPWG